MRVIGITGSIACGKSTVSGEMARNGYPVIDGDLLSRELTRAGSPVLNDIRNAFGDQFLLENGELNRAALGEKVFSDPQALRRLNDLMAQPLRNLILKRIEEARASGAKLCFLDLALLFEAKYDQLCDSTWCVWLSEDVQLERLMKRDGYNREQALSRMRSVLSPDEKATLASAVIDNTGAVEETLAQARALMEKERQRAENAPRRRRAAADVHAAAGAPEQEINSVRRSRSGSTDGQGDTLSLDRPEAARRKPTTRKAAWPMPKWLSISLISLTSLLVLSLTAQILMSAYLVRQADKHRAEQQAIDENYPLAYRETIEHFAGEYNLAPSLVAAIILNESSFRPTVESSVGARGLMQLMPDTAEWIAQKLRIDDYHFDKMKDPETNIRFGCWYLNYLSSLFGGDPLCVICAYHAGQGEVRSWLSNPLISSDGVTLMMGGLPEGQTRIYAGRVTRDYGIYEAKYFSSAAADRDRPSDGM